MNSRTFTIPEAIQVALQHQQNGALAEAEGIYRQVLAVEPHQLDALHLLGVLAIGQGRFAEAVGCFRSLVTSQPERGGAWCNLGLSLQRLGRREEALEAFRQAMAVAPEMRDAFINSGNLLREMGRLEEAMGMFRQALRLTGGQGERFYRLGESLLKGRSEAVVMPFGIHKAAPKASYVAMLERLERVVQEAEVRPHAELYDAEAALVHLKRPSAHDGLRILLIQPPYKKSESPPKDEDWDAKIAAYGLLSIAAQVLASGRELAIVNMSDYRWQEVEQSLDGLEADLIGLSCMTPNLPGVMALAAALRRRYPKAVIVAGGTHITALPEESLRHIPALDLAVIGEGEATFLEIIQKLEAEEVPHGVAGTAWRQGNTIRFGEARPRLHDLDQLASPHHYFQLDYLLSSRGCPQKCSYCGSFAMWGRKLRFQSVGKLLDTLEMIVKQQGRRLLAIKDDTFTASKKRTLEICRGMRERGLNFIWSCDTRIDSLDKEVLEAMRLAGCQRISLGVESGASEILETIHKHITPEDVRRVTEMAHSFGIHVRYYMMVGNRGESLGSFRQSLELMESAQPDSFSFCNLTLYPGTEEFEIYRQRHGLSAEAFFGDDWEGLMHVGYADPVPLEMREVVTLWMNGYGEQMPGRQADVAHCRAVLERLNGYHGAHLDLAAALLRAGEAEAATHHLLEAMEGGYPIGGHLENYAACIAALRGDEAAVVRLLDRAEVRTSDGIGVLNRTRFRIWQQAQGALPLELVVDHPFEPGKGMGQPAWPERV
ncbi:MAG: cobalamin-dependent protein [Magnetococcales bacterium]|nr:cobalamin-dependent protein [Magnetococcales bacterium]